MTAFRVRLPSRGWLVFAGALLVAAASSPVGYLLDGGSVLHGIDFKFDFVAAAWIARGQPLDALDRETAEALGVSLGTPAGPYYRKGAPSHTHPPPTTALVRPLLPLGFAGAKLAFFGLSLFALFVLAQILLAVWRRSDELPSLREAGPLALALTVWPPSVFNLSYGQWSILGATLIAAGWVSLERRAPRGAAAWFAAAIAIRSTPALLGGYLIVRARRVAAGVAVGVVAIVLGSWPFVGGLAAWRSYRANIAATLALFETHHHNTTSLRGVLARLFIPSGDAVTPFDAPALGHALAAGLSAALVALAFVVTIRRARRLGVDPPPDGPSFALWATLLPLLTPLGWGHNLLGLLLPAVLLTRDDAGRPRRVAVAVALVLATIPRETLFSVANGFALPFPASRAWLLGAHALAGLILFATACVACRTAATSVAAGPPAPLPDRS